MNEHERVDYLAGRFRTGAPGLALGIGDDAAVIEVPGRLVSTVDVAVEGVHFRRDFAPLDKLARRAFMAAVSDLAAMGARPTAALSSLLLPPELSDADFRAIIDGLADAAEECGCPIIGGNLSASRELSLTTTALGAAGAKVLTRDGARVGDKLYVTASPGDRALGLALLLAGDAAAALRDSDDARALIEAWVSPTARLAEGRALLDLATAAVDVSDGLLADLSHMLRASRVGAALDVASIPRHSGFDAVARGLGLDPLRPLLGGGEAYELLFTAPPGAAVGGLGHCIGEIRARAGVELFDGDARIAAPAELGFQHFR